MALGVAALEADVDPPGELVGWARSGKRPTESPVHQCTKLEVELPQSKRGIWIQDCAHRPPLVVPSWRKRQFPTVGGRFPTEIEPAY